MFTTQGTFAEGPIILFGRTPQNAAELNASARHSQRTQVYRLPVVLEVGDVILANAQEEFTNPGPENAYCATQIILTDSESSTEPLRNGEITEEAGVNITPSMHHWTASQSGGINSPVSGTYWVVFYVYWKDPHRWLDGVIERDYGQLDVTLIRGAGALR
jgi:hypothetical protein